MKCPHCYENISFLRLTKDYVFNKLPVFAQKFWYKLERLRYEKIWANEERRMQQKLKKLGDSGALKQTKLTDREHLVLNARLSGLMYLEISAVMNCTRERVRQIEAKAIRKLEKRVM
jgi:DNA-directed RNA polymerase sigma subunit (sigma70/sigma32)